MLRGSFQFGFQVFGLRLFNNKKKTTTIEHLSFGWIFYFLFFWPIGMLNKNWFGDHFILNKFFFLFSFQFYFDFQYTWMWMGVICETIFFCVHSHSSNSPTKGFYIFWRPSFARSIENGWHLATYSHCDHSFFFFGHVSWDNSIYFV